MGKQKRKRKTGKELIEGLKEAVEHARGRRRLRTTVLDTRPPWKRMMEKALENRRKKNGR